VQQTVSRFNGFAASGVDEDFHRGEHQWKLASRPQRPGNGSLGTVEKPPFYGIELHPAGGSSAGRVDRCALAGDPPAAASDSGAYASGNAAAATEQGIGYQAGLSLAAAMTFSYLAVRHMLGHG
jgi:3-oxosteroid 1-dehydrogenase